jgi:hypothetical protein
MEILPHFWITYNKENLHIIKEKKIKNIIHLSKKESFIGLDKLNEIKICIDYNYEQTYEEINTIMYQYLFDITEYIHDKIINNESILLIGLFDKQDVDVIIVAYYIRYGNMTIQDSIRFLKTKKDDIFNPKCLFYSSLNKFYYELNKNY